MARNGSGTFVTTDGTRTGPNVHAQQKAASVKITASLMDTTIEDIATALTASIAKDGQTTPTANLPMGTFKHTNVAASAALTDYARTDQAQNSVFLWGGTSGGSANAQTLTLSPAPASLAAGTVIRFIAGFANTGAMTLNVNGLGAVNVRQARSSSIALLGGQVPSGAIIEVIYDGAVFRLLSPSEAEFVYLDGSGNLHLAVPGSSLIYLDSNGTSRLLYSTSEGSFRPNSSGGAALGQPSVPFSFIYGNEFVTTAAEGISAAGSTISDATDLTAKINTISTVSAGQGVQLPDISAGSFCVVHNRSGTNVEVYPASAGQRIYYGSVDGGLGAPFPLRYGAIFFKTSSTAWFVIQTEETLPPGF